MNPLINNFTQNLKPCSGCGNNSVPWQLIQTKENTMQFAIQVVVEAEKASEATQKGESIGEVLSVNARPQQQRPMAGVVQGTTTVSTPR